MLNLMFLLNCAMPWNCKCYFDHCVSRNPGQNPIGHNSYEKNPMQSVIRQPKMLLVYCRFMHFFHDQNKAINKPNVSKFACFQINLTFLDDLKYVIVPLEKEKAHFVTISWKIVVIIPRRETMLKWYKSLENNTCLSLWDSIHFSFCDILAGGITACAIKSVGLCSCGILDYIYPGFSIDAAMHVHGYPAWLRPCMCEPVDVAIVNRHRHYVVWWFVLFRPGRL